MLVVAGLTVIVVTLVEVLILPSLLAVRVESALLVIPVNLGLAGLVAYSVFASIRVPRHAPSSSSPAEAMRVVGDTLPLLRRGLTPETAVKAARVMATFAGVRAVVIADRTSLLASEGELAARLDSQGLLPQMRRVMESRRNRLIKASSRPVAVADLRAAGEVLGALALIGDPGLDKAGEQELTRFAAILAQLLSMQVELGQMDRQAQLAAEAELNALRAQINPHFLFNALNTIIAYSRDDPQTTRRLLLRLADLFRWSMQSSGQMIPFADEYEQIKNYLYIEQARFRDKLRVVYDIDPQMLKIEVPALSVQPLVENAVRHGLGPQKEPGTLTLMGRVDFLTMRVVIRVKDDGAGMNPDRIPELLKTRTGPRRGAHGVGLANINERLRRLYGEGNRLEIESSPGKGTTVTMRIPMR